MKRWYSSEFPDRRLYEMVFQFELPADFPREGIDSLCAAAEFLAEQFGEEVEETIKMEDYACHVMVEPIGRNEYGKNNAQG